MPNCQFCGSPMQGDVCQACGMQASPYLSGQTQGYQQQSYGQPAYGQPPYGQAAYIQPPYGQPAYGQPAYGQPAYVQPTYGAPAYGQPAYGTPTMPQYSPYPPPYAPGYTQPVQQGPGILVVGGIILGILGIIAGGLGYTLGGLLLGGLAIGAGQAAKMQGQSGATAAMGLGVMAFIAAILFWVVVLFIIAGSF